MSSLPVRFMLLMSLSAVAACGGGSSPGSVTGTIHGQGFSVGDAISTSVAIAVTGGTEHGAVIVLSSTPNLCADAAAPEIEHPSEKFLSITLFDVNGATFNTPTVAGTYAIYQGSGTPPAKTAIIEATVIDANCTKIPTSGAKATTGTVTLTGVSGNVFSGNYDVALDSGDHITGSFAPEDCPGLQAAINSTAAPVCM